MALYNHKISTREIDTQLTAPVNGTAGLQVVIGTAPINMAENPAAAVNTPIIAYSFKEAVAALGYSDDFEKYTLCQSMDASFRVFAVAPVIFINVLDPKKHKKAYTAAEAATVEAGVATIKETGLLLDSIAVTDQDAKKLTKGTDYELAFDDDGYVTVTLISNTTTKTVTGVKVTGTQLDPTAVTAKDVIGGVDAATSAETGTEVIRQIYPKLGLVPGLILAPGWSQDASVAAVLRSKAQNINGVFNCECVIDMDSSTTGTRVYTKLLEAKTALAVSDSHAILVWPKAKLGKKIYYYSAVWAAMTAYTDAQHGDVPYKSPSNELINMSAAVLADGTEVIMDNEQAGLVNSYGIVTAINDQGWKSWGNNTSAYPNTTDPKDRWIACRRMMSWYRNHFILTYKDKVDDPTSYRLTEALVDSENIYLNSLTAAGTIAGGVITFNAADNPVTSILNGEVHFPTKIAFWTPAEWIENAIEFDPTILKKALGGN